MANTFEDILEPSSNNTPQNIMSFEDILSQEDSAQTLPSANSFEDILTQGDTTQVVPYSDDSNPNSFTNLFLFGKDNVEREIYKSLNLYSDEIGEAYPELGNPSSNNCSVNSYSSSCSLCRYKWCTSLDIKFVFYFNPFFVSSKSWSL